MKKLTALILALVLCIASTAFAADLSKLNLSLNNFTAKYEMSFKLNKPLEIISALEDNGYLDEIADHIDLRSLLESLADTAFSGEVKVDASKDYKKLQMYTSLKGSSSVVLNENFDFGVNGSSAVWMDMNFTDLESPGLRMISTSPFIRKYAVLDTEDLLSEADFSKMSALFSEEMIAAVNKTAVNMIEKYADISYANGRYKVKFDDTGFKGYLKELISYAMTLTGASDGEAVEISSAVSYLDGIQIIGKDGVTMDYILSGTKLSLAESKIHIALNVYDICKAIGEEPPEFLTEKNSNIDLTVSAKEKYSDIGSTKVSFPVLTEENTYQPYSYEDDYTYEEYEYELPYGIWGTAETVVCENGKYYLPLRSLLSENFEEGKYSLSYNDGVVLLTGELLPQLELIPSQNKIYVNSVLSEEGDVIARNGVTYLDAEAFRAILGYNLSYLDYSLIDGMYTYGLYQYDNQLMFPM